MLTVTALVVKLEPRAAILEVAGVPPQSVVLQDRSVDRVVDSLCLLLDALPLPERPLEVRIVPEAHQVVLAFPGRSQVLGAAELARLPELALAGPLAVARREAGDAEAEAAAGALAGEPSFWRSRYREEDLGWDLGEAAPPLLRAFQTLQPCRAVVVGCGQGHEVRALAKLGFEAVGVDFAPEAVERARALTEQAGLKATFAQADVLALAGVLGTGGLWVEPPASAPSIPLVGPTTSRRRSGRSRRAASWWGCSTPTGVRAVRRTAPRRRRCGGASNRDSGSSCWSGRPTRWSGAGARSSWPAPAADPRHLSPRLDRSRDPGQGSALQRL